MLNVYKKCEKSVDNPKGIIKINSISELNNPLLICLTSQDQIDSSVFGIIKEGARAARIRTSDELAGGFKIDDVKIDFIGIKYEEDGLFESLDELIYTYLKKNNNIKKQARNINFFTYCNAANIYVELEKRIVNKLLNDNYKLDEVKDILSQISVISIASQIDLSTTYATNVLFKDVNDRDVYDYYSKIAYKKMSELGRNASISYLGKNYIGYIYNGTGEHELREYFKDINIVKSSLCSVVVNLLENSLKNTNSNDFIPITSQDLLKTIIKNNGEFTDVKELLNKLDDKIDYGTVYRYSIEEHNVLTQIDKEYKESYNNGKKL